MYTLIKSHLAAFWQSPDFRTVRAELKYLPAMLLYFGVAFFGLYLFF